MALIDFLRPTLEAIDAAVVSAEAPRPQRRLSGGQIGRACERSIWYQFRWAVPPETFDGRKLRLFETGHVEEARMVAWLRLAGVDVQDHDEATGEQIEFTTLDGHFVGKLDGIATGILEAPKTPHLLECKTHSVKSFTELTRKGVAVAKPEHLAQMQTYMHMAGLTRAFYLAKCKDTDELWSERIEYDPVHAATLMARAQRVRDASVPPDRISDNPDYYICKSFKCPAYDVCHQGEFALRNCRTCLHSTPVADGGWHCARHDRELATDDQLLGCPHHLYLPGLVPGVPDDADDVAETVTYVLPSGRVWVDGEGRAA